MGVSTSGNCVARMSDPDQSGTVAHYLSKTAPGWDTLGSLEMDASHFAALNGKTLIRRRLSVAAWQRGAHRACRWRESRAGASSSGRPGSVKERALRNLSTTCHVQGPLHAVAPAATRNISTNRCAPAEFVGSMAVNWPTRSTSRHLEQTSFALTARADRRSVLILPRAAKKHQ